MAVPLVRRLMSGLGTLWTLELGKRGILAPGRWLWLRLTGWTMLLFVIAFGGFLGSIELSDWLNLSRAFAYLFAASLPIVTTLGYAWLVRTGERRRPSELSLRYAPRELLAGWLLGMAFMMACFALLWALGLYRIAPGVWQRWYDHLLFDAYISGVLEEVAFRAILLRLTARIIGPVGGLFLSMILFGAAHASHATIMQMAQIAINGGGILGLLYMLSGRLWLSIGMHTAYDFTESSLLGVGNRDGLFVITPMPGHSDLLTGGGFGPDGSVFASVVGGAVIAALLVHAARRTVTADTIPSTRSRIRVCGDSPHAGLQTAPSCASGAHVLKYAALRIAGKHRFRRRPEPNPHTP